MKIVLTSNLAWNIAHFRKAVVQGLLSDGHDVIAVSPDDDGVAQLNDMGVSHHPIHIDSFGTSPLRDARLVRAYRHTLRDIAPDIVLSYTIKPNIYGSLAARSLRLPFVPNVTGLGTAFMQRGMLQSVATQLYRTSFKHLPVVIFQNEDDRDLFLDRKIVTARQVTLVPGSGVDLDHFATSPMPVTQDAEITFLLIARLLRDKGVVEFVDAARQVRQTYPAARFQLLGDVGADNRTAIDQATVDRWVDEGVVEYLGRTDDIRPFVSSADCIVLPSYREGTPRTLLEAAAMGRPVVATDVPGCRHVVEDGVTGLLCRARDSEDLARACVDMIGLGQRGRRALGEAGRRKMEREFSQSIVVDTYRKIVDEVGRSKAS